MAPCGGKTGYCWGYYVGYGLPTNVVTDDASTEPLNRPAVTVMAVPAASFELAVVTYGVTEAGHPVPPTKKLRVRAAPAFTTTMDVVPSLGLENAITPG